MAKDNSSVVDLVAFNAKAAISAALQHVKNIEQTLHRSGSSSQGVTRALQKARQSLMEGWQDVQTMPFANTGIKHASIAMADVGARAVHAAICTLRMQVLSIGTSTHSQGLAAVTKDIPISTIGLFGGDLSNQNQVARPRPSPTTGRGRRALMPDSVLWPQVGGEQPSSVPSRLSSGTCLQNASTRQARWLLPVPSVDLPFRDTYCLKEEIPVAGHLVHFLPFWEEVIQANHWVLEIMRQGYFIEFGSDPSVAGGQAHSRL